MAKAFNLHLLIRIAGITYLTSDTQAPLTLLFRTIVSM